MSSRKIQQRFRLETRSKDLPLLFGVANSDHQAEAFDAGWPPDIRDGWELDQPRRNATRFWEDYKVDIENAASLGCKLFRFSVSWARIQPLNEHDTSRDALSHYSDVVAAIKSKGMEPLVTLLHLVWPVWLQETGKKPFSGLLSPEFPNLLAEYAELVAKTLRTVRYWCTINEPTSLILGYIFPSEWHVGFPPGLPNDLDAIDALEVLIPNLFLAHTKALKAIKAIVPDARVGANPAVLGLPSDRKGKLDSKMRSVVDRKSLAKHVKRYSRSVHAARGHSRFIRPLLSYHATITSALNGNWWHLGMAGKLDRYLCPEECVGQQDYVGLDYYWGVDAWWRVFRIARLIGALIHGQYERAPVWPKGLRQELDYLSDLFREQPKPVVILENGCVEHADGYSRADYIDAHVREVLKARDSGVDVQGYICWSISTNRELGAPSNAQSDFGLFHIDLDADLSLTRHRTDSASTYAALIAGHEKPD